MRLLHMLGAEEKLLCRGRYQYLRGGDPTGQFETWQITQLPDGKTIIRADIEGGESGTNLLTHLQRDAEGHLEWLRMRCERGEMVAAAQLTFEKATVTVARQAENFPRQQQTHDIAAGYEVDCHAVIGHDYVWRAYPEHARGRAWAIPIISPDLWVAGRAMLKGRVLRFTVEPLTEGRCEVPAGTFEQARRFEVTLSDGVQAFVWFDKFGIPLRWHYAKKDYDFVLVAYTRSEEE